MKGIGTGTSALLTVISTTTAATLGNEIITYVTLGINCLILISNAFLDIYRKWRDRNKDQEEVVADSDNEEKKNGSVTEMNYGKITQTGNYTVRAKSSDFYSDISNIVTLHSTVCEISTLAELMPNPEEFGILEFMRNEKITPDKGTAMSDFLNSILGENALDIDSFVPMDIEYIYNHSGSKQVSGIVKAFLKRVNKKQATEYPITVGDMSYLSSIIRARFLAKWKRLWDTVVADFDYLSPFDVRFTDETKKDHLTSTNSRTYQDEGRNNDYTYGFNDNSEDGTPTDRGTSSGDGSSSDSFSRDVERLRETTRKGNIGNITKQQLIEQQREMLKFQFFDVVYKDLDTVLTIHLY